MKVEKGKLITITYDLYLDGFDGELIESVNEKEPLIFLLGEDEMLETFEEKLQEFKEGDEFKFVLTKDEAYGDEDEDAVVEFPKSTFGEDDKMPEVGDYVPMEDEDGTVFDGTVYEITDDSIFIDFNHPLAGEDLYFTGKIIKVEDAPSK
jgi:FKBP-type peptidyl-prolyl cis-trans isomerase SlyD